MEIPAQTQPRTSQTNGSVCQAAVVIELCEAIEQGALPGLRWQSFLDYSSDLRSFYLSFQYQYAWVREDKPTAAAEQLIAAFKSADDMGLDPEDYDASRWAARTAAVAYSGTNSASFDLALSVSAMRYLNAVHHGRLHAHHPAPDAGRLGDLNLPKVLWDLIGGQNLATLVKRIEPQYNGYRRTVAALRQYLALAKQGDGPALPPLRQVVQAGDNFSGAEALRTRLVKLGDMSETAIHSPPDVYTSELAEAVKAFQARHGISPSGILNRSTYAQLNTPIAHRVLQLQLTLERWRWLPSSLPQRLIVVNIPEFVLRGYDNHQPVLSMPVVVGQVFKDHQTPIFQDKMEYIIFRPSWNVPVTITRREIIPLLKKNPRYLEKHDFELIDRQGQALPSPVDNAATLGKLRSGEVELRQKPGPGNSLGLIKFVFPNDYAVYMHGTPEQALFSRSQRAFSHGCIRVSDPEALALWVLGNDQGWTADKIKDLTQAAKSTRVDLNRPIPVLIAYGTAVVEEDGKVRFFSDVYGLDQKLAESLAAGYPHPK